MGTNAILIETHDENGVEWGVSVDGIDAHNPRPEWYRSFGKDRAKADAYLTAANALRCPKCGSGDLLPPPTAKPGVNPALLYWTCDPCGFDFRGPERMVPPQVPGGTDG